MNTYIAFLRGINAGVTMKMEVLRQLFEKLGLREVTTVLATGNVIFQADTRDLSKVETQIDQAVADTLGYKTIVVVIPKTKLLDLVKTDPFKAVHVTKTTVPQASFVKAGTHPKKALHFPIQGTGYTVLGVTDGVLCSVVDLSGATTPDLMKVLDDAYGKQITTRNWKTVLKVADKLRAS